MTQTKIIDLKLEPANALALAPFGSIVGKDADAEAVDIDFYKGAVAISYPAEFNSDHPVEIALASMRRRPPEVRYLERHFQHTQAFIPLAGKPFVAVMAPPCDGDLPDLSKVRAFLFDGSAGFVIHRGTWHEFPFAIEDDTHVIVLLSRQTGYDLKSKDADTEEASGPDLDKKDILRRTNTLYRFDIQECLHG